MAKRKYQKELFSVRRIDREWWVVQQVDPTVAVKKVEKTETRCVANQYADDYVEKYYVDLYLKQQMQAASKPH
ncbi:hypothetical protein ABLT94_12470 [Acinetobacter soli]|uniref:hypothetical protein n=1 Tax=Acinetobacter soli TaxID=487316 RepID=UPI0032B5D180